MSTLDDLNLWQLFADLAKTRNFSYTAGNFGVDVSTVSRRLTLLEKKLGHQLFVRNTRPLQLTPIGLKAQELMEPHLEEQRRIIDRLLGPNFAMEGTVRISAPHGISSGILTAILIEFQKLYPRVRFRVLGTGSVSDLISNQADIVCSNKKLDDRDYISLPRGRNHYIPVAAPTYIERCGMPMNPSELSEHTLFLFEGKNRPMTEFLVNGTRMEPLPVEKSIAINNILAVKQNVLNGLGVCVDLPFILCEQEIATRKLVPILPGWYRPSLPSYVVCRKETWNNKLQRVVMEWLQKRLSEYFSDLERKIEPFWPIPD